MVQLNEISGGKLFIAWRQFKDSGKAPAPTSELYDFEAKLLIPRRNKQEENQAKSAEKQWSVTLNLEYFHSD